MKKKLRTAGIRTEVIGARYLPATLYRATATEFFKSKLYWFFWYGVRHPSRGAPRHRKGKGKPRVNIPEMVKRWLPELLRLATAHDVDEQDQAEAALDDLLTPLLAAPVAQLREFYSALAAGMKADKRFPMVIWRCFEVWEDKVIKVAPDEAIKELKEQLARDIVELCERDAKEQLPEAIVRALMWREPAKLEEVKAALKTGGKARMVGRESCLYLEITPKGKRKPTAQVML